MPTPPPFDIPNLFDTAAERATIHSALTLIAWHALISRPTTSHIIRTVELCSEATAHADAMLSQLALTHNKHTRQPA